MIIVTNRAFVAPGYAEEFEQRFRTRAQRIDGMPGFILFQMLRPMQPNAPYMIITHWESRAHFQSWISSDPFRLGHHRELPKEAFTAPLKVEMHEVFLDSSRPDLEDEATRRERAGGVPAQVRGLDRGADHVQVDDVEVLPGPGLHARLGAALSEPHAGDRPLPG
jgi:heme-degrading monooxygenase HmoA